MGSTSDHGRPTTEPIAIIGLSCKLAGDATNPEKLWKMLAEGRSAWSEIPSTRFNLEGAFHPNPEKLSTVRLCCSPLNEYLMGERLDSVANQHRENRRTFEELTSWRKIWDCSMLPSSTFRLKLRR